MCLLVSIAHAIVLESQVEGVCKLGEEVVVVVMKGCVGVVRSGSVEVGGMWS